MSKSTRDRNLLSNYGIDHNDYMIMLEAQRGVCRICGNPPRKGDHAANKENEYYLSVDHDHSTGKIRALLCHRCNKGLGNFRDNTELLAKAILYLKSFR